MAEQADGPARAGSAYETDVRGRAVIVTGAGQGIGRRYALEFARAGASVLVSDIDGDNAASVAREIAAEGGRAVAGFATSAMPTRPARWPPRRSMPSAASTC